MCIIKGFRPREDSSWNSSKDDSGPHLFANNKLPLHVSKHFTEFKISVNDSADNAIMSNDVVKFVINKIKGQKAQENNTYFGQS